MSTSRATRAAIKRTIRGRVVSESPEQLVYRCWPSGDVDTWRRIQCVDARRRMHDGDLMELERSED